MKVTQHRRVNTHNHKNASYTRTPTQTHTNTHNHTGRKHEIVLPANQCISVLFTRFSDKEAHIKSEREGETHPHARAPTHKFTNTLFISVLHFIYA